LTTQPNTALASSRTVRSAGGARPMVRQVASNAAGSWSVVRTQGISLLLLVSGVLSLRRDVRQTPGTSGGRSMQVFAEVCPTRRASQGAAQWILGQSVVMRMATLEATRGQPGQVASDQLPEGTSSILKQAPALVARASQGCRFGCRRSVNTACPCLDGSLVRRVDVTEAPTDHGRHTLAGPRHILLNGFGNTGHVRPCIDSARLPGLS
jgi:hypothetical protein